MVSNATLKRRSDRRKRDRANALQSENRRLKKEIALSQRKAEHGCTNHNCALCREEKGDGTWKLSA